MKNLLSKLLAITLCVVALCFTLVGCEKQPEITELGIPTQKQYSLGAKARCPWDLKIFDGKLFVGCGDYAANTGPTILWAYDLSQGKWVSSGDVRDEAVTTFRIIGNKLTAPGIDPMGSWNVGSFYQYDGGKWKTYSKIPNGIHNYDIVEFGGKIYVSIGVEHDKSPVVVGNSVSDYFDFVPLYKNGALLDATTLNLSNYRSYDLLVFNNALYAMVHFPTQDGATLEVFKLNGDRLEYFSDASAILSTRHAGHVLLDSKIVYKNVAYFVKNKLFSSSNLVDYNVVNLPNGGYAVDLIESDGWLYILSYTLTENGAKTYIYKTNGGDIQEVVNFDYSVKPMSLEKYGDTYYVGMGDRDNINEKNGMILSVKGA